MKRALVLVVVLATAALAQPAAEEATKLLFDGEFTRALHVVDTALGKTKDSGQAARLLLLRGQCLLALGRAEQAQAAFVAALKKDVTAELDAATANPDALELFDQARQGFPGRLSIAVASGQASVRVDGKSHGPAPLTLELPAGPHVVEATAPDGKRARAEVDVKAGRRLEVVLPWPAAAAPPADAPVAVAPPTPTPTPGPAPGDAPARPAATVSAGTPRSHLGWIPLGAGVAVAGVGGILLWQAEVRYQRLANGTEPLTPDEEWDAVDRGPVLQTLGWVGLGLGAAAIATGAVLLALPPSDGKPTVSAVVTPDGTAWVGLGGRWP